MAIESGNIPDSILSRYASVKAIAEIGTILEIKQKNANIMAELEAKYPGIAAAQQEWSNRMKEGWEGIPVRRIPGETMADFLEKVKRLLG